MACKHDGLMLITEETSENKLSEEIETENQELETSLAEDVAMVTSEEVRESEEGRSLCSAQLATKIHTVILENVIRHLHRILVEKVSYMILHIA